MDPMMNQNKPKGRLDGWLALWISLLMLAFVVLPGFVHVNVEFQSGDVSAQEAECWLKSGGEYTKCMEELERARSYIEGPSRSSECNSWTAWFKPWCYDF